MSTVAQRIQLGPFFDQGSICGAATLEHYAAGTSALKNIWSDASMTTTLPQPFTSDANGIFNFFADGIYKFIIKRADGAVQIGRASCRERVEIWVVGGYVS